MKTDKRYKLLGISLLLALGLSACDNPGPGPAESAGKKIDQTAIDTGKKINDVVEKAGDKVSEQNAKANVSLEDAEITTKIKGAIFAEPGLRTLQISVDTIKGVVTLSGSVDTQANSNMAKGLAGAVSGVKEVINQLVLKPV